MMRRAFSHANLNLLNPNNNGTNSDKYNFSISSSNLGSLLSNINNSPDESSILNVIPPLQNLAGGGGVGEDSNATGTLNRKLAYTALHDHILLFSPFTSHCRKNFLRNMVPELDLPLSGCCPISVPYKGRSLMFHYVELGTPVGTVSSTSSPVFPPMIEDSYQTISWRSIFSLVQSVLFVCDLPMSDDKVLASDLAWFKHVANSGWFITKDNPTATVPIIVIFNHSGPLFEITRSRMDALIDSYTKAAGSDYGLRFHFTAATAANANLDLIEAAVMRQRGLEPIDTSLVALSFENSKPTPLKQMVAKRERRFNRSRDRVCAAGSINPSVVAKKTPTEAAKLVRILTCKYIITELNLRNCFLKKQVVQDILLAVKYNHTLLSLDLSSNAMGDDGMRTLPDVLGGNSTLKTLVLQDVDIGNVGAKSIAMALESNSTLEVLDISFNLIGSNGFLWLVNHLTANRTLASLSVRGNPFGLDGLRAVSIALDWSQSLVELDVTDTIAHWNFSNREASSTPSEGTFIVAHLSSVRQYASMTSIERVFCGPMLNDQEIVLSSLLSINVKRKYTKSVAAPRAGQQTFDLCNMGITSDNWPEAFKETKIFGEATSISLAGNLLTDVPSQILHESQENNTLSTLSLASNRLNGKLTSRICRLTKLRVLDLSQNSLTEIPSEISLLTTLESLDLRWNQITNDGLPIDVFRMTNLRHLLLQRNPITYIPEEVFKMTRLSNFQLAGTFVPLSHRCVLECWSEKRKELDLSSTRLRALPRIVRHLKCLQRLDLRDNELVSLPLEIAMLTNLHTLDLRFNMLNNLPWTIGEMSALKTVKLEGNPLSNLPSELVIRDTNFVKSFLLSLKDGQVPCNRLKLMVVGQANVGKTAIIRCLKETSSNKGKYSNKAPTTISTDGIDIESWNIDCGEEPEENEKAKDGDEEAPVSSIRFSVWDFAGQDIYYSTHQFFLTKDSVFLLVFNLIDPTTMNKVDYWLQSIQSRAPLAPVILVGTHFDSKMCNKDLLLDIEHQVNTVFKPHFPQIRSFISVSCKSKKNIDLLQSVIVKQVREQKVKYYPRSYLELEDIIRAERVLRMPPVMTIGEFTTVAVSCGIEESASKGVAQLFCNLGLVVYWNDGQQRLDDILVLDPQWLTSLFATIVTTKKNFVRDGILSRSDLSHIWHPPKFPSHLHDRILSLLENFGVVHSLRSAIPSSAASPTGSHRQVSSPILIPCLLRTEMPNDWDSIWTEIVLKTERHYWRIFSFRFIPLGFFARIAAGILEFTTLMRFHASGLIAETRVGKEYLRIEVQEEKGKSPRAWSQPDTVSISVQICGCDNQSTVSLISLVVDGIKGVISGWCSSYSTKEFEESVLCLCSNHTILISELEETIAQKKTFWKCSQLPQATRISDIAPDLTLDTFQRSLAMRYSMFQMNELLGKGSFGEVWLANIGNRKVAVKMNQLDSMSGMGLNEVETLRCFRRELRIGSSLIHPNIVALLGYIPFPTMALILEYVPHGNLYNFLRSPTPIGWRLRLRIAEDIAQGMRFLHETQPPMLHRDLKTPNVLMASLDPSSAVVAKLTDFGETRNLFSKFKGREGLSNPSWLAPEVMAGEVYTEKADIFAFGIVLWELYFRQYPYSEHKIACTNFTFKLEDAIIAGLRPTFQPVFIEEDEEAGGSSSSPSPPPSFGSPTRVFYSDGNGSNVATAGGLEQYNAKIKALPVCAASYSSLTASCWDRVPDLRSSFSEILRLLEKVSEETKDDPSEITYDPALFPLPGGKRFSSSSSSPSSSSSFSSSSSSSASSSSLSGPLSPTTSVWHRPMVGRTMTNRSSEEKERGGTGSVLLARNRISIDSEGE